MILLKIGNPAQGTVASKNTGSAPAAADDSSTASTAVVETPAAPRVRRNSPQEQGLRHALSTQQAAEASDASGADSSTAVNPDDLSQQMAQTRVRLPAKHRATAIRGALQLHQFLSRIGGEHYSVDLSTYDPNKMDQADRKKFAEIPGWHNYLCRYPEIIWLLQQNSSDKAPSAALKILELYGQKMRANLAQDDFGMIKLFEQKTFQMMAQDDLEISVVETSIKNFVNLSIATHSPQQYEKLVKSFQDELLNNADVLSVLQPQELVSLLIQSRKAAWQQTIDAEMQRIANLAQPEHMASALAALVNWSLPHKSSAEHDQIQSRILKFVLDAPIIDTPQCQQQFANDIQTIAPKERQDSLKKCQQIAAKHFESYQAQFGVDRRSITLQRMQHCVPHLHPGKRGEASKLIEAFQQECTRLDFERNIVSQCLLRKQPRITAFDSLVSKLESSDFEKLVTNQRYAYIAEILDWQNILFGTTFNREEKVAFTRRVRNAIEKAELTSTGSIISLTSFSTAMRTMPLPVTEPHYINTRKLVEKVSQSGCLEEKYEAHRLLEMAKKLTGAMPSVDTYFPAEISLNEVCKRGIRYFVASQDLDEKAKVLNDRTMGSRCTSFCHIADIAPNQLEWSAIAILIGGALLLPNKEVRKKIQQTLLRLSNKENYKYRDIFKKIVAAIAANSHLNLHIAVAKAPAEAAA